MRPFPFTSIGPRGSNVCSVPVSCSRVAAETWIRPGTPQLSMRAAVFTASPHRS